MLDVAIAIGAEQARGLALAAIERADAGRETRRVAIDWRSLTLSPGATVTIEGDAAIWRVRSWVFERMVLTLELVRIAIAPVSIAASSGRLLPVPDLIAGRTFVEIFELPPVDGLAIIPRIAIAACGAGPGWRSAALSISIDNGESWLDAGRTAPRAAIGVVTRPPGTGPATLADMANDIEIELHDPSAMLSDADHGALDAGSNLALVGDELLQFARAEPLGAGRWRLSGLWRGRRGSEWAIGRHSAGDRFVLVTPGSMAILEAVQPAPGMAIRVMAQGAGDTEAAVEQAMTVKGWSVVPPSPVHLRARGEVDGGLTIEWTRRSRAGWIWRDGTEVPIGEEREAYAARCFDLADDIIEIETSMSALTLDPGANPVRLEIRQIGTVGPSIPGAIEIN